MLPSNIKCRKCHKLSKVRQIWLHIYQRPKAYFWTIYAILLFIKSLLVRKKDSLYDSSVLDHLKGAIYETGAVLSKEFASNSRG